VYEAWKDQAACKGRTELFFAPAGEREEPRIRREALARAVCMTCPVLLPCRDHARVQGELGFWGAENDDERRIARRSLRRMAS
jgi:WhiB family transcriptional regulator, redox-sensing transcriptional regulator